ncbi:holin [Mycobacterium phage Willsammy]|uniref:Holin n=1 Tax=Mycobacterium phage Willsammy TaxID=2713268 RepID=A0A6G8R263_9CAUD|nr:holin [Mycobacterium phage Willsammy]QIN94251.1 holin [Mycobacterium phage Willsammy]
MIMTTIRQWFYLISAAITPLIAILVALNLISEGQGNQLLALLTALGGLIGGGAAGTAGVVLGKQRKDGTLVVAAPADAAITAIEQTVQAATAATAEVERVKQAASEALGAAAVGSVPVVGPLAQQAIDTLRLG